MIKNWKLKIKHLRTGFTIVETLVSLAIFSTSIVALIIVSSQGISDTNFAKNKLTASYLAQEGIELVRSIRDTDSNWNTFLTSVSDCIISSTKDGCLIDSGPHFGSSRLDQINVLPCAGLCISPLVYIPSTGFYNYDLSNGTNSIFLRSIKIIPVTSNGNDEIQIISNVSWSQGTGTRSVELTENLFNWQ